MSSPLHPIGTRYAVRERSDGTLLCIHRADVRHYQIERRMPNGAWRIVPLCSASSAAEALTEVDRVAAVSDATWQHLTREAQP
jgi:hypothetical protein